MASLRRTMRADRALDAMAAGAITPATRPGAGSANARPRTPGRPQWGLPTAGAVADRPALETPAREAPVIEDPASAGLAETDHPVAETDDRDRLVPESRAHKVTRDVLALGFVASAIAAGIYVGRDIDDPGLGVGIGFAVCFVGAVLIGRTVPDPQAKPPPRWAIVLSLVTSPLAIVIGLYEMTGGNDAATGRYRLVAGVIGLVFGFEQRHQRRRQLAGRNEPQREHRAPDRDVGEVRRSVQSETPPVEVEVEVEVEVDGGDEALSDEAQVGREGGTDGDGDSSDHLRRSLISEMLGIDDDPTGPSVEISPRPKVDGRAPRAPSSDRFL